MELLTLKSMLLLFGGGGNLYKLDEMESKMIFYKIMEKNFSNLFITWEKCISLNCGNFCRTTHMYVGTLCYLDVLQEFSLFKLLQRTTFPHFSKLQHTCIHPHTSYIAP